MIVTRKGGCWESDAEPGLPARARDPKEAEMLSGRKKKGKKGRGPALTRQVSEVAGDFNSRMGEINGAVDMVANRVNQGLESAGILCESLRDVLGGMGWRRRAEAETPVEGSVLADVDEADLAWLDLLVEAGIKKNRGDAASFLIGEGVRARLDDLKQVEAKVNRLRQERE